MWHFNKLCDAVWRSSFFVGVLCGFAGVFVDIDHVIKVVLFPNQSWRFLHPWFLISTCLVLLGLGAYFGGLHLKLVLRKRDNKYG